MKITFGLCPVAILLLAVAGAAAAQTPTAVQAQSASGPAHPGLPLLESKALFRRGEFAQAEAMLFAENAHPQGTPEGSRDSGVALMTAAFAFQQDGDLATAGKLANDALKQFAAALAGAASKPKVAAAAAGFSGFICEHLQGNPAKAETFYRKAVLLSPKTSKSAASALARLQSLDSLSAIRAANVKAN